MKKRQWEARIEGKVTESFLIYAPGSYSLYSKELSYKHGFEQL